MSETRRGVLPLPLAQSFVVCREIIEDCRTHDFVLIAPLSCVYLPKFPNAIRVGIYTHLTCGHGDYDTVIQMRGGDEEVLWEWRCPKKVHLPDPLSQHHLTLYDAILEFPHPGRYHLVLLTNEEVITRHALVVKPAPGPAGG